MGRLDRQSRHRSLHRQEGSAENVEPVNLCGFGDPDAVANQLSGGGENFEEVLPQREGSCLESVRPANENSAGRIAAAATTGPASGPRPASSMPAISPTPVDQRCFSTLRPQGMRKSSILRFFFNRHCLLAFAIAKVIKLGAAYAPGSLNFYF